MKKAYTLLIVLILFIFNKTLAQSNVNSDRIANGIDTIQKFASDSLGRIFVVDTSNEKTVGDNYHIVRYNTNRNLAFSPSVLESKYNPQIKIYPNPVVYDATIEFPSMDMYYVNIINTSGDIVYDQKELYNSVRISWQEFPSGIYYVRMVNMNDNSLYSEKVIKQ